MDSTTSGWLNLSGGINLIDDDPMRNLALAVTSIAAGRHLCAPSALPRLHQLVNDLADTVTAAGAASPLAVDHGVLARWCMAGAATGIETHERRAALFIAAWMLHEFDPDAPTPVDLTIKLTRLTPTHNRRPLLALEHAAVRAATYIGQRAYLRRTAVALAEAGGRTEEIAQVTVADVHHTTYDAVHRSYVNFAGSSETAARTVPLTRWGSDQISVRTEGLTPDKTIAFSGRGTDLRAASCSVSGTGTRIMRAAGLIDGDVTLESLRNTCAVEAWNGHDPGLVRAVLGSTTKNADQTISELVALMDTIG